MSSPLKKHPDAVADKVLKRVEVSKVGIAKNHNEREDKAKSYLVCLLDRTQTTRPLGFGTVQDEAWLGGPDSGHDRTQDRGRAAAAHLRWRRPVRLLVEHIRASVSIKDPDELAAQGAPIFGRTHFEQRQLGPSQAHIYGLV